MRRRNWILVIALSALMTEAAQAQSMPLVTRSYPPLSLAPPPAAYRSGWNPAMVAALPDSVKENSAMQGALVGGVALGLLGGAMAYGLCSGSESDGGCGGRALLGFVLGGTIGAAFGGMLASL